MVSSRLAVTSPSAMKYAVSVGVISMVARRMMPVSPLPPTVAQNSSASAPSGVSGRIWPSAVSRSIDRTWLPKLPALWWFLPWMSQAMAPPMVTCRVPGSTGTHSPNGSAAFISVSRLTPASTSTMRVSPLIEWMRVQRRHVDDQTAAVLGVVAVRPAQPAGDHATGAGVGDLGHRLGDHLGVARRQHLGDRRGGAAPAGQPLGGCRNIGGQHRQRGYRAVSRV